MPHPETPNAPLVHRAPGTDQDEKFVAGPESSLKGKPLVHTAPEPAEQAVITPGQTVAEVFDALETEAKKRAAEAGDVKPETAKTKAAKSDPNSAD